MALNVPYTIDLVNKIKPYNIDWIEEFLPPDDVNTHTHTHTTHTHTHTHIHTHRERKK